MDIIQDKRNKEKKDKLHDIFQKKDLQNHLQVLF